MDETTWLRAGEALYQDCELCAGLGLGWRRSLRRETMVLGSAAASGGPVAVLSREAGRLVLAVFSSCGEMLATAGLGQGLEPPVIALGWCDDLVLVLVFADGRVLSWGDAGHALTSHRMVRLPAEEVHLAHVWPGGLVVLAKSTELFSIHGLRRKHPVVYNFGILPVNSANPPRALAVLTPQKGSLINDPEIKHLEIAVALGDRSGMLLISERGRNMQPKLPSFSTSPSAFLIPHPKLRLIASLGLNGELFVFSMEWDRTLLEHQIEPLISMNNVADLSWSGTFSESSPVYLSLCVLTKNGDVAVFAPPSQLMNHEENNELAIFPLVPSSHDNGGDDDGDEKHNPTTNFVVASVSEIDGYRVLTHERIILIRPIPLVIRQIYQIGSDSALSRLVDASEALESALRGKLSTEDLADEDFLSSSASMMMIFSLKEEQGNNSLTDLTNLVENCLLAAESEVNVERQMRLLRAAAYGKMNIAAQEANLSGIHIPTQQARSSQARISDLFTRTCQLIRIVNSARDAKVGAITCAQLRVLTTRVFLDRLIFLGFYFVVSKIAQELQGPRRRSGLDAYLNDRVLIHWSARVVSEASASALALRPTVDAATTTTTVTGKKTKASSQDDGAPSRVLEAIRKKMPPTTTRSSLPFTFVAYHGRRLGKEAAAMDQISRLDQNVSRRIIYLLSIGDLENALCLVDENAVGFDPEMIPFAGFFLLHMTNKKQGNDSYLRAIWRHPNVVRFLFSYLGAHKPRDFEEFLSFGTGVMKSPIAFEQYGYLLAEKACCSSSAKELEARERIELVKRSIQNLEQLGLDDNGTRESVSHISDIKCIYENEKLMEMQARLSMRMIGRSLADSVLDCIVRGEDKLAEQFRDEFKMSMVIFARLRLKGLARRCAWNDLQEMAISPLYKSLLSNFDYAEVCLEQGNESEAARYAHLISEPENKVYIFSRLGLISEAAGIAHSLRDSQSLVALRVKVLSKSRGGGSGESNNNQEIEMIDKYLEDLNQTKGQDNATSSMSTGVNSLLKDVGLSQAPGCSQQ